MLTDLCQELRNWFDRNQPKYFGSFSIHDGDVFFVGSDGTETSMSELDLATNQYFRIVGSVFNDGVHKYGDNTDTLKDEVFDGAIWLMAVPKEVIDLSAEIDAWVAKNKDTIDSPYNSESFGGYSYSKGSGENAGTWVTQFAYKMANWRKI